MVWLTLLPACWSLRFVCGLWCDAIRFDVFLRFVCGSSCLMCCVLVYFVCDRLCDGVWLVVVCVRCVFVCAFVIYVSRVCALCVMC